MDFDVLKKHVGHNVVCVEYNNGSVTYATALECEDCKETLVDFTNPDLDLTTERISPTYYMGGVTCPKCGNNDSPTFTRQWKQFRIRTHKCKCSKCNYRWVHVVK